LYKDILVHSIADTYLKILRPLFTNICPFAKYQGHFMFRTVHYRNQIIHGILQDLQYIYSTTVSLLKTFLYSDVLGNTVMSKTIQLDNILFSHPSTPHT
jgi:hypothetical protein